MTEGVVGQAGLGPGIVMVVFRRSTVRVQPLGNGTVVGPVHVICGTQGGAINMVDV